MYSPFTTPCIHFNITTLPSPLPLSPAAVFGCPLCCSCSCSTHSGWLVSLALSLTRSDPPALSSLHRFSSLLDELRRAASQSSQSTRNDTLKHTRSNLHPSATAQESAASTARLAHSLSSLAPSRSSTTARPKTPPQPVKPSLASQRGETTDAYPSRAERFANSTSLQLQSARNAPPPPPRRLAGAGADGERPTRVPPERAAKRAALASAARGVSSAGQAPARLPRSGQSATHVSVGDQSLTRPVPAPPYEAAIASPPTLPTRTRPPPNASGRVAAPNRFDEYDEQDKEAFFEALDEVREQRATRARGLFSPEDPQLTDSSHCAVLRFTHDGNDVYVRRRASRTARCTRTNRPLRLASACAPSRLPNAVRLTPLRRPRAPRLSPPPSADHPAAPLDPVLPPALAWADAGDLSPAPVPPHPLGPPHLVRVVPARTERNDPRRDSRVCRLERRVVPHLVRPLGPSRGAEEGQTRSALPTPGTDRVLDRRGAVRRFERVWRAGQGVCGGSGRAGRERWDGRVLGPCAVCVGACREGDDDGRLKGREAVPEYWARTRRARLSCECGEKGRGREGRRGVGRWGCICEGGGRRRVEERQDQGGGDGRGQLVLAR